jgi:hypothetical protein
MLRVNLVISGINEKPVDIWVSTDGARMWLDMVGKRIKLGNEWIFHSVCTCRHEPYYL